MPRTYCNSASHAGENDTDANQKPTNSAISFVPFWPLAHFFRLQPDVDPGGAWLSRLLF
jgi:hypothetical protein